MLSNDIELRKVTTYMIIPKNNHNLSDTEIEKLYGKDITMKHFTKNLMRGFIIILIVVFTLWLLNFLIPSLSVSTFTRVFNLAIFSFSLWFAYDIISSQTTLIDKFKELDISESYISKYRSRRKFSNILIVAFTAWVCFFSFLGIINL